ncbi:hypothetical protein PA0708 [Candidatus Phytoplasma australiense]|uniref:Uncharacterized protein n=1 Tax=Phytoplasma australiense TaxID=59748 RepID=B1VAR9_PHYAS|nr:hypothetical protein PA0708 [Candidatus Phytoplasma australiense]
MLSFVVILFFINNRRFFPNRKNLDDSQYTKHYPRIDKLTLILFTKSDEKTIDYIRASKKHTLSWNLTNSQRR